MSIAASRAIWTPGQLDTAVDTALREFDRYTEIWVGAAAHELAYNHESNNLVRDAIVNVGKTAHRDRIVGHAVFKVVYNPDSSSRLGYECVSPVFDEPPVSVLAGFRERREGHFDILSVVEPL